MAHPSANMPKRGVSGPLLVDDKAVDRYILNSGMSLATRGSVTLLKIPGSAFG